MQLCLGFGVTATTRGADGPTQDMAIGIYGPSGGPVNIVSFSPNDNPPFLTSSSTGCEMLGFDAGPLGPPFDTQASIYYAWDPFGFPACSNGFTCVSSTAACGNAGQQCITFTVVVDAMPDSIRVWGVEGAGNPNAGCYPNADMLIEFSTLPVVWGDRHLSQVEDGNRFEWTTLVETNSDYFEVHRSADGFVFEKLAIVPSKGNGNALRRYEFLDDAPLHGTSYYKLRQVDVTGDAQESNVLQTTFAPPKGLKWISKPGSSQEGEWDATFFSDSEGEFLLEVFNAQGVRTHRSMLEVEPGVNAFHLPTSGWAPGIYFLNLAGRDAMLRHRFVRY